MSGLNYSTLPMLLDENVRTVGVKFWGDRDQYVEGTMSRKVYTYLTTHEFEVDDLAVVFVSGIPKAVKIVELDADTPQRHDYKWIVCPINTEAYDENVETSAKLTKEVRKLEKQSQRKQVLEALGILDIESIKAIEFK